MPKLNEHGLGGGGKAIGVPVYPFSNNTEIFIEDLETYDVFNKIYGDATAEAPVEFKSNAHCVIGDEMFFIGTRSTVGECYKYNVKTREWTKLSNNMASNTPVWAVVDELNGGTDIYYGATTVIYKYDTLTDTHSHVFNVTAYPLTDTRVVYNNGSIWISGGNYNSNYRQMFYQFSLRDYTFTKLTNLPVAMYAHGMVSHGDSIYLFGGITNPTIAYRYDVLNATFTSLANIPNNFHSGLCVSDDNFIYLINSGSNTASYNRIWIYDIAANKYTEHVEEGTAVNRADGHAGIIDDLIYVIGGTNGPKTGYSMRLIAGKLKQALLIRLFKNTKLYTDGNMSLNGESLDENNGAVTIPSDGEYTIVDASYATIGG